MGNSLPRTRLRAFLGASLCAALIAPAAAGADTKTTQFEEPLVTAAQDLHRQDGWSSFGSNGNTTCPGPTAYDHNVVKRPGAPADPYGNAPAEFGSQFMQISSAYTDGAFASQTYSKQLEDNAGEPGATTNGMSGGVLQPRFIGEFDFFRAQDQTNSFFVVSPDRGDGARMSRVEIDDSAGGIDVTFTEYDTTQADGDEFQDHTVATGLSPLVPHKLKIDMTFVPGVNNDVVSVSVDGLAPVTGNSWEDYFRENEPGVTTRTVDSLLFRTASQTPTCTPALIGKGFLVDNVRLQSFGGANGAQGPQGTQGNPGGQGPQGNPGGQGSPGADGADGADGAKGDAGSQGSAGANGQTGPAGPQGLPGAGAAQAPSETDNPVSIASGTLRASRSGVVRVPISCPADAGLCEGTVQLTSGRTSLGSKRFVLRGGRSSRLSVKLTKSAQRRLKARSLKRARVSVFSRDLQGDATETVRTLSIR
jgi:hypothetical protein